MATSSPLAQSSTPTSPTYSPSSGSRLPLNSEIVDEHNHTLIEKKAQFLNKNMTMIPYYLRNSPLANRFTITGASVAQPISDSNFIVPSPLFGCAVPNVNKANSINSVAYQLNHPPCNAPTRAMDSVAMYFDLISRTNALPQLSPCKRHNNTRVSSSSPSSNSIVSPEQQPYMNEAEFQGFSESGLNNHLSPPIPNIVECNSLEESLKPSPANSLIPLPSAWNPSDKCMFARIQSSGLGVYYNGPGRADSDSASVRSNHPIPEQCSIYYYEITIGDRGRDGAIAIGFSTRDFALTQLPGADSNSWGYHGDDGKKLHAPAKSLPYGPSFENTDIIGCGIDFTEQCAFFTRNGLNLGVAFTGLPIGLLQLGLSQNPIYPCIGLRTPGETITANFGSEPFAYDIESYIFRQQSSVWSAIRFARFSDASNSINHDSKILSSTLSSSNAMITQSFEESSSTNELNIQKLIIRDDRRGIRSNKIMPLDRLTESVGSTPVPDFRTMVAQYLRHYGYTKTLESFSENDEKMQNLTKVSNDSDRFRITNLLANGRIEKAESEIERAYPGLLASRRDLIAELRLQNFLEIVGNGNPEQAMHYGQQQYDILSEHPCSAPAFSLLAYCELGKAPLSSMLNPRRRQVLASFFNAILLQASEESPVTALERVLRQAVVVGQELTCVAPGLSSLINIYTGLIKNENGFFDES